MASVVRVSEELGGQIDQLVASGRYASRVAVVEAGVQRINEDEAWLRMVQAQVAEGRADIAAGRVHTLEEVFDSLDERYRNWPR